MMTKVFHPALLLETIVAVVFGTSIVSSQSRPVYNICDRSWPNIVRVSAYSLPFIVQSPHFGRGLYDNNVICSLVLQTGPDPVCLSFAHRYFHLEDSVGCVYDSLCVHGQRFCGNRVAGQVFEYDLPANQNSTVLFQTNNVGTGYGFEMIVTPGRVVNSDDNGEYSEHVEEEYPMDIGEYSMEDSPEFDSGAADEPISVIDSAGSWWFDRKDLFGRYEGDWAELDEASRMEILGRSRFGPRRISIPDEAVARVGLYRDMCSMLPLPVTRRIYIATTTPETTTSAIAIEADKPVTTCTAPTTTTATATTTTQTTTTTRKITPITSTTATRPRTTTTTPTTTTPTTTTTPPKTTTTPPTTTTAPATTTAPTTTTASTTTTAPTTTTAQKTTTTPTLSITTQKEPISAPKSATTNQTKTTTAPTTTATTPVTTTNTTSTTTTSAPNTTTAAPNTTTAAPNTTTSAPNTTYTAPTTTPKNTTNITTFATTTANTPITTASPPTATYTSITATSIKPTTNISATTTKSTEESSLTEIRSTTTSISSNATENSTTTAISSQDTTPEDPTTTTMSAIQIQVTNETAENQKVNQTTGECGSGVACPDISTTAIDVPSADPSTDELQCYQDGLLEEINTAVLLAIPVLEKVMQPVELCV